ncbi:zinc ribbon domain-containing protein, partial [Nocardioides stalactiti]|uniref:zinc ribbon domain-containing protein n=1 Tax=Nocardioides stalactiti TaxID=2755356 RepID=UPI001C7EFD7D
MGNCWSCGEPRVHEGDEFCRNCGQAYGADPSAVPPAAPTAFPPAAVPPAAPPTAFPPAGPP